MVWDLRSRRHRSSTCDRVGANRDDRTDPAGWRSCRWRQSSTASDRVGGAGCDGCFYLSQLVGVSFFNHTAELRFVAVPGLLLIGLAIASVTAAAARLTPAPARRKVTVALAMPIFYALLVGLSAQFAPLHLSARGFGEGITVSPSPVEAFLLPLGWGVLFASFGGLIGAFGRNWRREGARLLGAWAAPMAVALRFMAAGLTASALVALISALTVAGGVPPLLTGGSPGQGALAAGGVLLALPTLVAAVFISGFGVPFNWNVDALSEGHGSISALGGAVPTSNAGLAHGHAAPGVLALAPVLVLATIFTVGWLSARRSGPDPRLCLANALRAATLLTLAAWLLGLLARVDAQAGGLLGFHLAPDGAALLWRVPAVTFVCCLIGSLSFLLSRGPVARRRLAQALRRSARPSNWWSTGLGGAATSRPLGWRAALGVGFAAVPLLVVGLGPAGAAPPGQPAPASVVPIEREAEQKLERASAPGAEVAVTASPDTRVINTASVQTPLQALGIQAGDRRAVEAKQVLNRYGEMFGVEEPKAELGEAETITDELGSHTYFNQMADGLPVFGARVGVHLSPDGKTLTAVMGSLIPDVSVADEAGRITGQEAIAVAKKNLPAGKLAQPAHVQVFAGITPYFSGPNARKAWFVWLMDEEKHASNEYVVDAATGKILDVIPKTDFALKSRRLHRKRNQQTSRDRGPQRGRRSDQRQRCRQRL